MGRVVKYPSWPAEVYSPYDTKVLLKNIVALDLKPAIIGDSNPIRTSKIPRSKLLHVCGVGATDATGPGAKG